MMETYILTMMKIYNSHLHYIMMELSNTKLKPTFSLLLHYDEFTLSLHCEGILLGIAYKTIYFTTIFICN